MNKSNTLTTKLALGTLCLALTSIAHAGSISFTLDANFGAPDYSFYSYTDTTGAPNDSIPVGPYITSMTGDGLTNALVYTFCYDFNSPTNVGTAYTGSFAAAPVPTDPTYTATLESTYLINELNALGLINAPADTRGAIALAIWEIMNPSSTTTLAQFPSDPAAQPWEQAAALAVANGSWTAADSAVYPTWIPDDPSIQRFGVVFAGQAPVPEPASLGLIGLGLLGIGLVGRRQRMRPAKSVTR